MNTALGEAGAAGAIQPEGAVVFACLHRFQAARSMIDPLIKVMQCYFRGAQRGTLRGSSDDNDMPQILKLCENWRYLLPERSMDQQDVRAAVIEHIDIVIGAQQGIHRHGDGPYFYSAEKSRGKLGRIEQQECDALFHVNTQVEQPGRGVKLIRYGNSR